MSDVLLLDYNTDIEAYYIMLTDFIRTDELRVPQYDAGFFSFCVYLQLVIVSYYSLYVRAGLKTQFLFKLVLLLIQNVKVLFTGKYLKNMFPDCFLLLSSLHHLSCCSIKITSCTEPSPRATP